MKKIFFTLFALTALLSAACTKILEEQPRAQMTPEFFSTEQGIKSGLTAVYSQLRWMYGPAGMMYMTVCGTDEATYGDNKDGYGEQLDAYNITSGNSGLTTVWNNTFPAINTCSGIIEEASEAGVDAALVAEAKFFRAFNYFLLVQTFGDVPLDLGSGELKFNTTPSRFSTRNKTEDVYTKAIFPDLQAAVEGLPETPREVTATNKIAARHFLAKAYLTYAWWLERNGKTDPAGKTPAQYYQLAYDVALEAIKNPTPFALQPTFYDVNVATNDYNKEILLSADHTASSYLYDESSSGSGGSGPHSDLKANRSNFVMLMDFELSIVVPMSNAKGDADSVKDGSTVTQNNRFIYRQAVQSLGRPWRLIAPTHEVFTKTFPAADRENDSRFDGTFATVFRANYQSRAGYDGKALKGMNKIDVKDGDTVFYFPPTDDTKSSLTAISNGSYHYYSDKPYAAWTPSLITRHNFPSVWKFGPNRDNKTPNSNPPMNDASTRPFPIAKLSETYLIAAEAAVKGAATQAGYSARELVNVLRARAGKWKWSNSGNAAKTDDKSQEMLSATPAEITIDYILMERSRELYAENLRWYDLTRTGKLEDYAKEYTICENRSAEAVKHTRSIEKKHYLRPVPGSQFDNMDNTDKEKEAYQNTGY
ncbi:MAG: RagB/SusD family nutrient uptake outer membrane protein [Prevotellaceae bacterium]|jgi:hypothetical protein|nr:RagB/SusD family nutrient uptake outer membrane protein [Prevotellaceae bacterium]